MKTLEQEFKDIYGIAHEEGLYVIETTSGANGYPENLKKALIGFDTFRQAQEIAKKYDMRIEKFFRRDGWNMWQREGEAFGPIAISADDFGDDYEQYTKSDLDSFFENEVRPQIGYFKNFEDLKEFIDEKEKLYNEIEDSEDGEIVVACEGRYYDTLQTARMEFSEDSKTWAIGVI